jgi:hypothetical protein
MEEEEGLCVDDEDFAGVATGDPPNAHGMVNSSPPGCCWLCSSLFSSSLRFPLVSPTTFFFKSFT